MKADEFDWGDCAAVWRDAGRMSGVWCFKGTRLPISALFSHLAHGSSIPEFMEWFPPVEQQAITDVLEFAASQSGKPLLRRELVGA